MHYYTMPRTRGGCLLGLVTLLLFVLLASGCAASGPIRSQVLDAQTNQPIPGAVVLGVWTKRVGFPGLDHTETVAVRETEVDAQGNFELVQPGADYGEESVTIYRFGYVAWNNLYMFPRSERRPDVRVPAAIRLERFPENGSHQRHVSFISGVTWGRDNPQATPRFWNAYRPEVRMP
jgi:hypothetical protein